jgi:2-oxo-4-hydroxy-4-carboxy-5-ureidoimidazoline decarboxylase
MPTSEPPVLPPESNPPVPGAAQAVPAQRRDHVPARGLDRFNSAPPNAARAALLACCGSRRWAHRLAAHRPYPDLDVLLAASDEACYDLTWADLTEALSDEAVPGLPRNPAFPPAVTGPPGSGRDGAGPAGPGTGTGTGTGPPREGLPGTNAARRPAPPPGGGRAGASGTAAGAGPYACASGLTGLTGETGPRSTGGRGLTAAHTALRAAHAAYESRFGHVFVICLDGLEHDELLGHVLAGIRDRLGHDVDEERAVTADELRRITRGRLTRLVANRPDTTAFQPPGSPYVPL